MKRQVEIYNVPDPVIVIRSWFTSEELSKIWEEIDTLSKPYSMQTSDKVGGAVEENSRLKTGYGLFLDQHYFNRRDSSFILSMREKFFNENFYKLLLSVDKSFNHFINSTSDTTLLNYYEENHSYKKHFDRSIFTCVVPLWQEPKKFDGGDFLIADKNFNLKSNDLIIFPGYVLHEVKPITVHNDFEKWKSGRFSLTTFINYRSY